MFGYVKTCQDELKIKEYNVFRSYYCGLCKTLKAEYGFFARLGLNYDSVFLALLLSSVQSEEYHCTPERCMANPFKKRPVAKATPCLSYSAAVMMLLALLKLEDDIKDEHSIKALLCYTALWRVRRKVKRRYGDLYAGCKAQTNALKLLEKSGCSALDEAAHPSAKLMETVFVPKFIQNESHRRILAHIGYLLGRFIYILDAYEDLEQDKKKRCYNVFLQSDTQPDKAALWESLTFTLSSIAQSYELLPIEKNKSILDNILYLGLADVLDRVLNRKGATDE